MLEDILCVSKSGETFMPGSRFVKVLVEEQAYITLSGAAKYPLKLISFL
jgi:hypothetical protein